MAKRRKPKSAPAALTEADGPPAVIRAPILSASGDVELRPALAEAADWRDPADVDSARARHYGAREIHGWRRVWTIAVLHRTCPREITAAHVKAAERFLADYELGIEGANSGRSYDRVDGASSDGISDLRLDATQRYRDAMAAVGEYGGRVLVCVVIDNWGMGRLAVHLGLNNNQKAHGRLYGALERLREHYWPPRRDVAPVPVLEAVEPVLAMAAASSADRLGRWRDGETHP